MWLATSVNGHVPLERIFLSERFATFSAYDLLSLLVLRQQVLVKVLLRDHAPFAYVTLVFRFVVRPLLMYVQRATVLT